MVFVGLRARVVVERANWLLVGQFVVGASDGAIFISTSRNCGNAPAVVAAKRIDVEPIGALLLKQTLSLVRLI